MHRMPFANLTQTIPNQEFVITRREQSRRHIDQDRDPAVIHIAESFAAEEDSRHDPRSEIASEVCGDRNVGEAPDHGAVGKADGEGGGGGGDEGIRGVETGQNYNSDVGIDEELD